MTLYSTEFECPIGTLTLVAGSTGLRAIVWPTETVESAVSREPVMDVDEGVAGLGPAHVATERDILDRTAQQLREYFAGDRREFDVLLDLRGTDFQLRTWDALMMIPYGETWSYGDQAAAMNAPTAVRAVGGANGRNPIPIIVPCHRVIGASGKLTGFTGGLDSKRLLLDLEQQENT